MRARPCVRDARGCAPLSGCAQERLSALIGLLLGHRAENLESTYLEDGRVVIKFLIPWQEVVLDLNDEIKSMTQGYASFDYEQGPEQLVELVKVTPL